MDGQPLDDGLKWFGEGFDGFPRRLPDDCVEYVIYVIDDQLKNAAATRLRLNELLKAANELKRKVLKDHIWQRDGFELFFHPKIDVLQSRSQSQGPPHLQGRTNFGDSIADEWLVVYLLVELSKKFSDAWVRVHDGDGEFLLVEAANALPKWLNPDIADNRIWINNGQIKIIPIDSNSGSQNLTIDSALSYIRNKSPGLLIDASIHDEAFRRMRDYPSAIPSSLHNAIVTIPRNLAYVLHENSSYTSPATEAFYLRDPISLKPLNTKDLANLTFAPEGFVNVSVKFTKVSYAQLYSQVFDTPPAWTGFAPRLRDERASMGMKLTCGFEMLVSDPQNQSKRSVREIKLLLSDLETDDAAPPSDADIASWPQTQDDEKWLDIDYHDFEAELSGQSRAAKAPSTSDHKNDDDATAQGETSAHRNLHDLVSRFRDFMDGDEDGAFSDEEDDDAASTTSSSTAHSASTVSSNDFQRAIDFTRVQTASNLETSGLIDEARRLALAHEGDASAEADEPTEEEVREIMERMRREKGKGGAAATTGNEGTGKGKGKARAKTREAEGEGKVLSSEGGKGVVKPFFGPERPPHLLPSTAVSRGGGRRGEDSEDDDEDDDEDVWPGNLELSSDEEDEQGVNDVDLTFARNMLEAFKGQAGMSGPAGNLMRALGVGPMPRDEGEKDD